jgi:Protein of unknown function (DUF3887)
MTTDMKRFQLPIGLALALLACLAAQAAGGRAPKHGLVPRAVAFVHSLANGDFKGAEADFTGQMRAAAPPEALSRMWQQLLAQMGPFQDTGGSRTIVQGGYTTVAVRTDFKNRAVGIAVSFDSARRIAGIHIVPPP